MTTPKARPTRRQIAGFALAAAIGTTSLATTAVAPAAQAAENPNSVWVGTHNTHYGDGDFPAFAGVIGWQEVNDPVDRDKMRNRLGADYSHAVFSGAASAVPISWNSRFAKVAQFSVKTHDGEAGVTPARYVNSVILQNKETGMKFAFVNTHFISGAWGGDHPERQARWLRHLEVLKSEVSRLQSTERVRVVVVGDFNRRRAESLPNLRMLDVKDVAGYTIDQIYVPGAAVSTASWQLATFGSDHHAYKARVDW